MSIAEFDTLVYGLPSQASLNYFRSEYQNIIQSANNFVGNLGQQFLNAATNIYQNYVSPEAIDRMKHILKVADTSINTWDGVRELQTLNDLTQAGLTMQRFVMAQPRVRRLWQMNQIDGYMDTYFSADPMDIADEHHDYRRVKDGHIELIEDEDGHEVPHYRIYYVHTEVHEDDIELDAIDRADILSTWENIDSILDTEDVDITNPMLAKV